MRAGRSEPARSRGCDSGRAGTPVQKVSMTLPALGDQVVTDRRVAVAVVAMALRPECNPRCQ